MKGMFGIIVGMCLLLITGGCAGYAEYSVYPDYSDYPGGYYYPYGPYYYEYPSGGTVIIERGHDRERHEMREKEERREQREREWGR